MGQMLVLQAVAPVVFVAQPSEQLGKRKFDSVGLAFVPSRGTQEVAAGGGIDGLHLLDSDDPAKS